MLQQQDMLQQQQTLLQQQVLHQEQMAQQHQALKRLMLPSHCVVVQPGNDALRQQQALPQRNLEQQPLKQQALLPSEQQRQRMLWF